MARGGNTPFSRTAFTLPPLRSTDKSSIDSGYHIGNFSAPVKQKRTLIKKISSTLYLYGCLSGIFSRVDRPISQGEPVFDQIETVSLAERVISALKEACFTGKLKPGDSIVERQLAREMNVGTPVVREALISLKHEGFIRRAKNKGNYVTQFTASEVRQLYALRIELETLALQWARLKATEADLAALTTLVERLVEAGTRGSRSEFLKADFEFHRYYWRLSGNPALANSLERLMAPLFAFVVLASEFPITAAMAHEHYMFIDALRDQQEPEFTSTVRKALGVFASRWITQTAQSPAEASITNYSQ